MYRTFQVALMVKNLPVNAGDIRDIDLISGSRRSPGGGHGNPFQYSFLENSMDRGGCPLSIACSPWQATVHGVAKSRTQLKRLSMHTWSFHFYWVPSHFFHGSLMPSNMWDTWQSVPQNALPSESQVLKDCWYIRFTRPRFKLYACHFSFLFGPQYFPGSSDGKASAYNEEDPGSIPGSGRCPEEGNGNRLQYSCLENPRNGGSW